MVSLPVPRPRDYFLILKKTLAEAVYCSFVALKEHDGVAHEIDLKDFTVLSSSEESISQNSMTIID
jgi:hypothetical protein